MVKKVLLVEDEKLIRDLLEKKLKMEGYEVFTAKNGVEALEKMKEVKLDLILLDILMPQKNGFEVMEEMQKNEELKEIPIIIISNSGQQDELGRAKDLGVKDWLIKTEFDPYEVLEKVKKYI